ncbi:hypothetical protein PVK06_009141 [Gossypium arboreum]|uniref:Uncharacterized protein n=1 Tax=Gossypium arboreum TaxID=29729 RepID=A0ABR0QLN6_GOSAR|nr:hypothetical protein PVK06_009141 [Gossypium arboreum]
MVCCEILYLGSNGIRNGNCRIGVGKAQPTKTNPVLIDPATIEKETKEVEEETEKTKSISIAIDCEEEDEANPTHAPLVDNTAAIPPPFTESMTEQDHEINQIIEEITKSDDEQEDVLLQSLKMKMHYKHNTRKSTRRTE